MAAQCAVCLEPVEKGEKFALQRTEVVHHRCLGGQTLTTKIKLAMFQTKVKLDMIEREARELRLQNESIAATKSQREYELHLTIGDLRREAVERGRDLRTRLSVEANLRQERNHARLERDEAIAARDAAVRELALRQTLEQSRVTSPPAPATPSEVPVLADDRDPSEVRFSLLEIDPS